ncbi:response regulator [Poritiphilus flavus]|uniref:Response regulator n=1 Tax=Poritiphilus flavus TaxID=2697053 RepID=A0A6L9ECZ5_9FLAO|nr:response regulator [Poritiphilus flavus]NAS12577.1 response regulator [Poritiphilus flavus]
MNTIETVCIIDDDPIFVYGAKRMIKEAGFCEEISVYENGSDALLGLKALDKNGQALPSVIFLDLNMPIMNGWDFLADFITLPAFDPEKTLIYVISSSVDPRDLIRIKDTKVISNYILKPLTAEDLENILSTEVQ